MLKCRTLKLKKLVREGTGKCVTGERSAVHSGHGSGSVTIKGLREGRECTKEAKRACGPALVDKYFPKFIKEAYFQVVHLNTLVFPSRYLSSPLPIVSAPDLPCPAHSTS